MSKYNPEIYWSEVANRIKNRGGGVILLQVMMSLITDTSERNF